MPLGARQTFNEDDCRIRTGDGPENFAILRRTGLNLLKQEKSGKSSMNTKRLKAGWSTAYIETVLGMQQIALGFMQLPRGPNCHVSYEVWSATPPARRWR